jgi:signal transduction histidine kinase
MPPAYSLAVDADDLVRIGLFTIGAVLTASLHSATRKATAEALKARAAAEEVNAAQNRFLAMVTHELRGPLNPILLWTGLLEGDERIPEDLRPVLGDIRRNVQMEVRLIDDLLDLVKARHGKLRLQQEYVGVRRLLEAAVDLCRPDLVEKQIEFTLECGDAGLRVYGDPLRLGQVFWNLLRNATKFTPAGGRVRINTRLVAGPSVVVEVSDTGIGIERDRLAAIFEAFEQGGDAIPAVYGGLGLGLAICQAIVNAHGGRIGAASEGRGKGATFTVALPSAGTVFDAQHSPGEVGPNVARAPIAG